MEFSKNLTEVIPILPDAPIDTGERHNFAGESRVFTFLCISCEMGYKAH
ncbi:hypothetical protein NIASO_18810 [Niabella soli DSM 19437]|uniref:Uncharacterized protein n=1 Tax=Niabella soli DSM 19437 TaxID=929713 RepID=W0F9F6_9BACT|nr:hypothetical protein NIASO_18810 [Niabella soli DSM 19437]